MNQKQQVEMGFWQNLFDSKGEGYWEFRGKDAEWKMKSFRQLKGEKGIGLDVGCGLGSVFEFTDLNVIAIDPLMDEYRRIANLKDSNVIYQNMDGEDIDFPDNYFDFVFCVNVIDHTPNQKRMASEIYRVLKPGGNFYFQVNFDDILSSAHYNLWNNDMVNIILCDFELLYNIKERDESNRQFLYWAHYKKR